MNTKLPIKTKIYVVNLARSSERLKRITEHLDSCGLGFQRVDAVDALTLDITHTGYDVSANAKVFFAPLKPSEVACYESHRKALQVFLSEDEVTHAVILEDDVEFIDDGHKKLQQVIDSIPEDTNQIVKLYAKRSTLGINVRQISQGVRVIEPVRIPLGFPGQIWTRSAAKEFLAATTSYHLPVDIEPQMKWRYDFTVSLIQPNLIREISHQVGGSTITSQRKEVGWDKLKLEVARPWFRLKLLIKSVAYTVCKKRYHAK